MNEESTLAAFASLSNATRLRILRELVAAGPEGLCAGEIANAVGASPSRASFHLSNMSKTELITSSRSAREITYRADYKAIGALISFFMDDCCGGDETIRACCVGKKNCC
ncbi:ArsR/SmtB family transcription factor [Cohaesibacter gelatinilyticus]|uniref:Transcriptional regulator, ArsR family n=1 Tax=Cohaesibacter gelatinilyticus TaxID=372072 RepID=A0A285PCI5_9HYPH|nr:metalloregulator ArsR/SmtB family transcription factor [Cohaesibacter gelatinilyticus]SNZ19465.1 transcriptional regulator, ArsR family [Cohaesibacter gelatinilyticus]